MWCLVSTYMWIFLVFFYLVLVSFSCVGEGTLCNLNLLKFVNIVSLTYGLSWRMFAPCALEKNVYSAVIGWNVLYMSVWYNWLIVLFLSCFLINFCVAILSISESRVLKFPTTTVLLSVSPFSLSVFASYIWVF